MWDTRGRGWLVGAALALLVWTLHVSRFQFTCDDAYISFRYARNAATGLGLVYNAGESPPVEGYSNLLWTLVLALAGRMGFDLPTAAAVLTIASGAALILLVARHARLRLGLVGWRAAAVPLFAALLPPLAVWATSGLETMPFALAVFLVYERLTLDPARPRAWQAGLAAAAAALLRVDGAGFALLAAAAAALDLGLDAARRRALVIVAATAVGVAAAHALWRLGYHGDWVPHTARVKTGASALRLERGAKYALAFLVALPVAALAPAAALLCARGRGRRLAGSAALFLLATLAYCTWAGGDFMPFGRFLVPALPFVALAFAVLVQSARFAWIAAALLVGAPLASLGVQAAPRALHFRWNASGPILEREMWRGMDARAREWSIVGRALARRSRPGDSIVLGGIGAIGYFSGLHVFDLYGLVSPEVVARGSAPVRASAGHDRQVGPEFFLPRHPTFLGAWIAPSQAPGLAGAPEIWIDLVQAGQARLERFVPAENEGFPAGTELRVLRTLEDG